MSVIVVTGTPGVGKTTVARRLAERLNYSYLNLATLAFEKNCIVKFDRSRKTFEIDLEKLRQEVEKIVSEVRDLIIDGHIVEVVPAEHVDWVIVLRLHPIELEKRLRARDYPELKIRENLESEILDYVLSQCVTIFGKNRVIEVDTTGKSPEQVVDEILSLLERKESRIGIVDWLADLEERGLLKKYLSLK